MSTPTPAPLIAAQATADLRAGIEALRDEWGDPLRIGFLDEQASEVVSRFRAALDALLGGA